MKPKIILARELQVGMTIIIGEQEHVVESIEPIGITDNLTIGVAYRIGETGYYYGEVVISSFEQVLTVPNHDGDNYDEIMDANQAYDDELFNSMKGMAGYPDTDENY